MNDNNETNTRPTSPLEHLVRRLRELDHAVFNRSNDDVLRAIAVIDFDELADEIERLQTIERRMTAAIYWITSNQLDAFKRGLWDAINDA